MEPLVDRWNALAETWWSWTWPAAWQAALVAGLVLLVLRLGSRWPAPLRHGLVLLALLKFVTPPLVALPTGVFSRVTVGESSLLAASEPHAAVRALAPVLAPPASARPTAPAVAGLEAGPVEPFAQASSPAWARIDPLALVFTLHLAGILVALARLALQALEIHAERRRARAPRGEFALQHEALASALGFRRMPELCISRGRGPMAIGLFSRAVLVPQVLARLGPDERAAILAHELVHHRRRDLVVGWLTALGAWRPSPRVLERRPIPGHLAVQHDLRRIYAALLEGWLGVPGEPVLGGRWEALLLLAS